MFGGDKMGAFEFLYATDYVHEVCCVGLDVEDMLDLVLGTILKLALDIASGLNNQTHKEGR
jgi:hypothetical protein